MSHLQEMVCILEKVTQWWCGMYKFVVEVNEHNIHISVGCILYTGVFITYGTLNVAENT
jgi:hypothetical protein